MRLERPEPFVDTRANLNTGLDRLDMLKISRVKETIQITHTQFSQPTTGRPGNQAAF
jgi:hypothetical protein